MQLEGDISTDLANGAVVFLEVGDDDVSVREAATLDDLVMRFGLFHITATWSYSDVRVELPLHVSHGDGLSGEVQVNVVQITSFLRCQER